MQTLYIDVYFLINFTVDILALYFSVRLLNIKTSFARLCISSGFCSVIAIIDVFSQGWLMAGALFIVNAIVVLFVSVGEITLSRRVKLAVLFYIFMMLLGGVVSLMYNVIDRFIGGIGLEGEVHNRGLLIFSLIILCSIGVLRGVIMIFSNRAADRTVRVMLEVADKSIECEALVDSGNLAKDPMGLKPILFISKKLAERLFPRNVVELSDIDSIGENYRKRIRLIPITRLGKTHIMTGIVPDRVAILLDKERHMVDLTIAIDKEGEGYGGLDALIPLAVLEDVI